MSARDLYLDLLKRTLTGIVYEDPPVPVPWSGLADGLYRPDLRAAGVDWPQHAPCMIGLIRLAHVQQCVEQALADDVPGDLAEAGVWRGGTVIFLRALLAVHGVTDRSVWAIDSFAGLPGSEESGAFGEPECAALGVPLPEVQENFRRYGMLDDQVKFLEGWFADSLPGAPVEKLAVLRLDGDLYQSQRDALAYLYPKLSPGGYVIIDDAHLAGCARAVREYRDAHGITSPVTWTEDKYSLSWRKS